MKADDRFYTNNQAELFCDGGCVETEKEKSLNVPIFDFSNISEFIQKLNSINAPYVKATYTNLESKNNVVVYLTISLDKKSNWPKGILENSKYGKFRIQRNGTIEKVSGNLPKFKTSYAKTQDDVIAKLNKYILSPEKYDDGGNLEIQTAYVPASDVCETLNTLVPSAMATELKRFNQKLVGDIEKKYNMTIAEYVAMKLHYDSVDELCYDPKAKDDAGNRLVRFAQEQIDAIATAIYSHEEKGDAIIIADQTGVGKGRTAAGIIRYAILEKQVIPFFFTEKKHLINDIYRDLIDIGFDAGIIEQKKTKDFIKKDSWTEEEILSIIYEDIEQKDDVTVDYEFPEGFNPIWIKEYPKMDENTVRQIKGGDKSFNYEQISEIVDDLIREYNVILLERGKEIVGYDDVSQEDINEQVRIAKKEGKQRLRPFFPNDTEIVDKDGNILYGKIGGTRIKEIYGYEKDGKKWTYDYNKNPDDLILPKEFKLFMIPFSQVNSFEEVISGVSVLTPKFRFFQKYANNSVIIIDEAHAASGSNPDNPSNTYRALSDIIERSSMTTYLSATYAKRETNMPLYAKATSMRESGLSDREMIETFKSGGNALKEAVSAELTRNGQLLRREKMIQGKSDYYYADAQNTQLGMEQVARMNIVANLFTEIRQLQADFHAFIGEFRKDLPDISPLPGAGVEGTKQEIEKQRTIKALTFQMFNFFLLGLKIKQTTEFTIEKLKNGIKPVITIANTLESALKNMPKTYMTDNETDRYKVGESINNDFNLYLAYLAFYIMHWKKHYTVVNDEGIPETKSKIVCIFDDNHDLSDELKDEFESRYTDLLQRILNTPTGVSIAPIDEIKYKIKKEGFSIDEITGRQLFVQFSDDDFSKGIITKRDRKDVTTLVRDFNENKVDCLLINQSGAVGISMHARPVGRANIFYPVVKNEVEVDGKIEIVESGWPTSLDNKEEVKKRAMIVTQMELDINKEVQKLGRINRTGQVYPPEFTYIISAIPSESRLTALMEKKLRSLSANVSSNQQQSAYLFESDDFFSVTAIPPFNETIKILARTYTWLNRVSPAKEGLEEGAEQIKDFTKALYFADYNLQKEFYDLFTKLLNEHIANLIKDGLFTGKVSKKDYKAETIAKFPFYIGKENAQTSFGRHSFIEKASITEYLPKNSDRDIAIAVNSGYQASRFVSFLKSKGDALGDALPTRLADFKKYAKEELKSNIKKNKDATEIEVNRLLGLISTKTDLVNQKKDELSKYGQVSQIIELESKLSEVSDKIKTLTEQLSDAIVNNPAKIAEIGTEMASADTEKKDLKAKIDAFGDVSQIKQEFRGVERDIKTLDKDILSLKDDVDKANKNQNEYANLMNKIADYVDLVGKVFTFKTYAENVITTDENGQPTTDIQKYEYNFVNSEICVVTKIEFPIFEDKIIPSTVRVTFHTITDNFSLYLSQLSPKISELEASKGKKPLNELVPENVYFYDKIVTKDKDKTTYWKDLVKQTDTGVKKIKWFVVGSVLKSFMLSKRNGYTGEILKFTMKNNIDRIGIEIYDKENPSDRTKSTYTDLDLRYDDETSLQYLTFFDANSDNVEKLMTNYIYDYLVGRLYDLNDNKNFDNFTYDINYNTKFVFYISSNTNSAILITPGKYLIQECIDTYMKIKDGNFDVADKIEKEDLLQQIDVDLLTDNLRFANIFALMLQRTGVDITDSNFRITSDSIMFKNVTPITYDMLPYVGLIVSDIFKTIFPIDLENTRTDIANKSKFDYFHKLNMTYKDFLNTLAEFEKENQKPTFSIGSNYFKTQKHLYVLEQFKDNITDVEEVAPGQIDFVPVEENDIDKQISSMIDNLVKIISNE